MPELAEVEFYRRRWSAGHGEIVTAVAVHAGARVFRRSDPREIAQALTGARLLDSAAAAKQMLFRFNKSLWLGVHLGMSGELRVELPGYAAARHDHLVLAQKDRTLVFNDPRMFGAILFHRGSSAPDWWKKIAPAILSSEFTVAVVGDFLRSRPRAPIKAALLMQERFPGIGNWMADEILWRARLHPRCAAGSLSPLQTRTLHRECRAVSRNALKAIAGIGSKLPPDLNVNIPETWLFKHRWRKGGQCPRCEAKLAHAEVGGRTSCWCPRCQPA